MTFNDIFKSSFLENVTAVSLTDMVLALMLSFGLGLFIYYVYRKTYAGVMFSQSFGGSLIAMTMITTMVILAVTSNVVLSLGMVGALSIVRFRTAVKDPMDTAYMFWALTMGILLGAGQFFLTAVTVVGIAILLTVLVRIQSGKLNSYLLVVRMADGSEKAVAQAVNGLKFSRLKSKTISAAGVEATYEIRVEKHDAFLNKVNAIPGVQDAALVAYTGESV